MRRLLGLSLMILLAASVTGCAPTNGSYIDPNGTVYNNISDNAAYNMAVRDAYIESDKNFATALQKLNGNPVGQMGIGMAYAFKQGQGPRFQQPKDWVDKTMQLYPLIRDILSLGWGLPLGGGSGSGGAMAMEGVNIGGDFYANGSVRNDRMEANGYQANVDLSRSGGSVTEDNDVYEGNAQSSNGGGDGDTGVASDVSDDDSLLF